jgi:hypothetical protein
MVGDDLTALRQRAAGAAEESEESADQESTSEDAGTDSDEPQEDREDS